jgi:predicted protein tyrosine phosphatase
MTTKPLRTSTITVCGVGKLDIMARKLGATHVVTLIRDHGPVPTPKGVLTENHLRVDINDINQPEEGMVHPQDEHVAEVLNFIRNWDHSAPMIVHCFAGISRSTASAFSGLCALNPDASEALIAQRLRQVSPTATPNRLIVSIADDMLGRGGRMVDAIDSIGMGESAMECVPFSLPSRHIR